MIKINPDIVIKKYVMNRIRANKNWLCVLCGPTGSGKSYFSLGVCEKNFPKFTVDSVVFTVQEYLDKFSELDKAKRHGDIILFDESHEFSSRRSMSEKNVMMTEILSMIRFTRISSIFTLPDLRQVDVGLVRLMHNYAYTMDIDRKTCPAWQKKRTGVKFYEIFHESMPNKDSRDFPFKYPNLNVNVRNNRTGMLYEKSVKIKELWLNSPSEDLLEQYEQRKRRHFDKALANARSKLRSEEMKQKNKMNSQGIDIEQDLPRPHNPSPEMTEEVQEASASAINNILD